MLVPRPGFRASSRAAEARHVTFGVAHLEHRASLDPALRPRLRAAVGRRHDALAATAGLDRDVFDSLVSLAVGSWAPLGIARGHRAVKGLEVEMDEGHGRRSVRLGFPDDEAAELSASHTRNFMRESRRAASPIEIG